MKTEFQIKRLGEVCEFQNGFAFKSSLFVDNGLPILRISNIQNDVISKKDIVYFSKKDYKENFEQYEVKKGSIVIAMSGGTTGKLGINDTDEIFYLNQRVGKFIPKSNLSNTYLYYFLKTKTEEGLKIAAGAAIPNLSTEQIKNYEIPVPPISEQQRLVEILDKSFAAIDALKQNAARNAQNARDIFQSALQKLLSPKEGWDIKKLGEVCDVKGGSTPLRSNKLFWENGSVPWFTVEDIRKQGRIITYTQQKITEKALVKTYLFPIDTVLLCCTASVGEYALTKIETASNQQFNGLMINDFSKVAAKYLFYFCSTLKDILLDKSGKTTIDFVSTTKVKEISIPIPPISEQHEIVSQLDALSAQVRQLEEIYNRQCACCDELKQSILAQAFCGDL